MLLHIWAYLKMINDYSLVLFDGLKIGDLNLGSPTTRVLVTVILQL
jgi:hypothetical protein